MKNVQTKEGTKDEINDRISLAENDQWGDENLVDLNKKWQCSTSLIAASSDEMHLSQIHTESGETR